MCEGPNRHRVLAESWHIHYPLSPLIGPTGNLQHIIGQPLRGHEVTQFSIKCSTTDKRITVPQSSYCRISTGAASQIP